MAIQDIDTELLERKFKKRFSQLDTDDDGFVEREDYSGPSPRPAPTVW
jgi:hypothetical protein